MVYYDQPQRSQIVLEIFPKDGVSVSGEKKMAQSYRRMVNYRVLFSQQLHLL